MRLSICDLHRKAERYARASSKLMCSPPRCLCKPKTVFQSHNVTSISRRGHTPGDLRAPVSNDTPDGFVSVSALDVPQYEELPVGELNKRPHRPRFGARLVVVAASVGRHGSSNDPAKQPLDAVSRNAAPMPRPRWLTSIVPSASTRLNTSWRAGGKPYSSAARRSRAPEVACAVVCASSRRRGNCHAAANKTCPNGFNFANPVPCRSFSTSSGNDDQNSRAGSIGT